MKIETDPGNKPVDHLYLDNMNRFEKEYKEIRKNRLAIERAKRERQEFKSGQPLRFP